MMSEKFFQNLNKFLKDDGNIVLLKIGLIEDGVGGQFEEEVFVKTLKALIRPLTGDEKQNADKDSLFAEYVLYILYEDVKIIINKQKDYLIHDKVNDRKYKIEFIKNLMHFNDFCQVYLQEIY